MKLRRTTSRATGPSGARPASWAIALALFPTLLSGCVAQDFGVSVSNYSGQTVWVDLTIIAEPGGSVVFYENITLADRDYITYDADLPVGSYTTSVKTSLGYTNQTAFQIEKDLPFLAPSVDVFVRIFPDRAHIGIGHGD